MIRIDVITLFPRMFEGALDESMLKIAQEQGAAAIRLHDLRDYSLDKHRKVDARPYGGGPGMVLCADPVFRAVEAVRAAGAENARLILLTPAGRRFDQAWAQELAREPGLILLCGHYEGFDERVLLGLNPLELSIGDYVLTGGEIPAMAVIDTVVRLQPGVLGDPASTEEESFSDGLLEYPHYTRPREYRGMTVPEVLLQGNHAEISAWRRQQAEERTRKRRRDLLGSETETDDKPSAEGATGHGKDG